MLKNVNVLNACEHLKMENLKSQSKNVTPIKELIIYWELQTHTLSALDDGKQWNSKDDVINKEWVFHLIAFN